MSDTLITIIYMIPKNNHSLLRFFLPCYGKLEPQAILTRYHLIYRDYLQFLPLSSLEAMNLSLITCEQAASFNWKPDDPTEGM